MSNINIDELGGVIGMGSVAAVVGAATGIMIGRTSFLEVNDPTNATESTLKLFVALGLNATVMWSANRYMGPAPLFLFSTMLTSTQPGLTKSVEIAVDSVLQPLMAKSGL